MLTFSDEVLKEFTRGFDLLKALNLPEDIHFDYSGLAKFLNPVKIKSLCISHIMYVHVSLHTEGDCIAFIF